MKEVILEFLEWMPNGVNDIYELLDNPEDVTDKYLKEKALK